MSQPGTPEAAEHFDAIVIGSGQGGGPLAVALARAGRKTAMIEREHAGGTCVNEGCTPTKTIIASARVAHLARRAADYGVHTGPVTVDLARVRERKRKIVDDFRSGSEHRQRTTPNLDYIDGEARFLDRNTLAVKLNAGGTRTIRSDLIILNTGERPAVPDLSGIERVPYLNSTSIMELDRVPERLLVIGGGYVGLEFGQAFQRFGSQVTIFQRGAQLLPREDGDVAEAIADILRQDGLEVLLNTTPTAVERAADGTISLTVKTPEGERTLQGTALLAAAGRVPNTEALNLEAAGIATDRRGYIPVNERLETNVPGIYAIGDVKGPPAFTHISYDDYRILQADLIQGGHATTRNRPVPYTVFIDPQLGRVGMSEREAEQAARERGLRYRVAKIPMTWVARALEVDETRGFLKAIVDADTKQILGFAALAIEGGELMSAVELAMMGHLPYTELRDAIFAHPTLSESLNNLFMAMDD